MKNRKYLIFLAAVVSAAVFTGCGDKEEGTKYEYEENIIYEEDETSIKLLNSTESEEELKLKFAIENFETEDVKVKVYNPEDEEITENIECSFDAENSVVSIKGDVSQVEMAEVDLNYNTNLKVKELKNEEFKYLLTNYEDDHGCTYLGDLDDFQVNEEASEDGEEADSENAEDTEEKKPAVTVHMSKSEIFDVLKGKWISSDGTFSIEFSENSGEAPYRVKASGENGYDSEVSYFDETKTEDGSHKIRFVTSGSSYSSCRELILSADEKKINYITGIRKNDADEYEEVYIECHK